VQIGERWQTIAWTALLVQIPFELRYTLLGLSNLQWTFVVLVTISIPGLYENRHKLKSDRMVQAAALFVAIQWIAAAHAPEFHTNAYKAAIRFSAGFLLLAMARTYRRPLWILRTCIAAAVLGAVYALVAQTGWGLPVLFRNGEFFIAQVQRLSGSFEYPNVAAAYFAMSLVLISTLALRPAFRWSAAVLLWCALILTFSRGAVAALIIVSSTEALLLWKKGTNWRKAAGLIGAGIVAVIITLTITPYTFDVLTRSAPANPPAAQYRAAWNRLREQPDTRDQIQLNIRNAGNIPWLAKGGGRVALGYQWQNRTLGTFEKGLVVTDLPHDVQPGETIELFADFHTPKRPGQYALIIGLFVRNFDWFSNAGVVPAVVLAEIQPGAQRVVDRVVSPATGFAHRAAAAPVPRSQLWHAALEMFLKYPFGVGPDNYRLLYGRFLGLTQWNTDIYSNSLYLELLTGSGILGLGAFALIVISMQRHTATAGLLAVCVFLIHGFVDVFLMTTPIYFSFWILLGLSGVPCMDDRA
jgi:hypothetical protein